MSFESDIESRHKEMLDLLDSINPDDIKAEGVTLSFGGKSFKFKELEIFEEVDLEAKLRKEFKYKLNTQQQRIREKINGKINQLLLMHQQKQQDLDRKEKELKKQYSNAAMMPDIHERHMVQGLSVVKGSSNNELIWIYRGIYNPKYIIKYVSGSKKRQIIPSRLVNRMKTDILIVITTKGDQIIDVKTKQNKSSGVNNTLPKFPHYHQTSTGDCWGSWKHPHSWKTPDDILRCAKDAEAVLEVINTGSIASRGPSGLPRLQTLEKAAKDIDENAFDSMIDKKNKKKDDILNFDNDGWSI